MHALVKFGGKQHPVCLRQLPLILSHTSRFDRFLSQILRSIDYFSWVNGDRNLIDGHCLSDGQFRNDYSIGTEEPVISTVDCLGNVDSL